MPPKVTAQVPGDNPKPLSPPKAPAAGTADQNQAGSALGAGAGADVDKTPGGADAKDPLKMIEITEDELRIAMLVVQAHNRGETHFDPTAEPEVVAAEDLGLPVEKAAAAPVNDLPDAKDIDPTKISRSVLTKQGWVSPNKPANPPA